MPEVSAHRKMVFDWLKDKFTDRIRGKLTEGEKTYLYRRFTHNVWNDIMEDYDEYFTKPHGEKPEHLRILNNYLESIMDARNDSTVQLGSGQVKRKRSKKSYKNRYKKRSKKSYKNRYKKRSKKRYKKRSKKR